MTSSLVRPQAGQTSPETAAARHEAAEKAEARCRADLDTARVTWGLITNPTLDNYLNGLLDRIKEATPNGPTHPRVYIIPLPQTDAETTAAGNIFISIGWIRSVKSEDELVALLAHEYGHVVNGHHSSDLVGDLGTLGHAAYLLKVAAANATPGIAGDVALGMWNQMAHPAWKRDQEREADAFALGVSQTLHQSYVDGMKAFLERVREWESRVDAAQPPKKSVTAGLEDTHPRADERLADIQRLLAEKYPDRVRGKSHRTEWRAIVEAPGVTALLARHKTILQAHEYMAAGKNGEALRLARSAPEGDGMAQPWVVTTLTEAMIRNGQMERGVALLAEAANASEPNPQAASLLARLYLANNRPMDAKEVMDRSFERLNKPEVMYPEVIGFYRAILDRLPPNQFDATRVSLAKTVLTAQCITYPMYKDSCILADMTAAERAARDSAQLARQKKMEQDVGKAVEKLFK